MKKIALALSLLAVLGLTSCNGPTSGGNDKPGTDNPGGNDKPEVTKKDFTGLVMNDETITFDGKGHTITLTGAPDGAKVTYSNAGPHINVGSYKIGAKVTKEGYNDFETTATLTISKADYSNLTFQDKTIEYDGLDHKNDMVVIGVTDPTAEISYVFKNEKDEKVVDVIETGTYTVIATITSKNFNDKTLTATLKIKATEKEQFMTSYENNLYFNNPLDRSYLYKFSEDGSISRVSGDVAKHFVDYGEKKAFISEALFLSSINTLDVVGTEKKDSIDFLFASVADVLVSDGTNLYYSVNGLTNESSGIYKVNVGQDEVTSTLLYQGKTKYLNLVGDTFYFADSKNGNKLSSIPVTGATNATLVKDIKINNLVNDGTNLVFTVNELAGDYIARINVATNSYKKLTIDAGKYLTIVNDEVYYSNVDFATSTLFGKGIYKVPLNGDYSALSGTKIIDGNDYNLSSLYYADANLYYYKVSDKHLYSYNINSNTETDLLEGFVPPEYTPITMGGKTFTYKNKVYYTNIYDGKTLYVYDEIKKTNTKLTTGKIKDFYINDDILYFNQVSYFVDNSLYRQNLLVGGTAELLSEDDANGMIKYGNYLYYAKHNAAGITTGIERVNLANKEVFELYTKGVKNIRIVKDKMYFIDGDKIYTLDKAQFEGNTLIKEATLFDAKVKNVEQFEIKDNALIYTYKGMVTKEIRNRNLTSGEESIIVSKKTDPIEFILDNNNIYYYTFAESAGLDYCGIYKTTITGKDGEQVRVLANDNKYYASSLSISGSKLYFVNYAIGGLFGDSHIYQVDLTKTNVAPIAIDKE